jgi:type IV pilus assembly protein PilP
MRNATSVALVIMFLGGCAESPEQDLRAWMRDIRQQSHAVPSELPARAVNHEFTYVAGDRLDPFDIVKISTSQGEERAMQGLQPDTRRTREPLESMPLDNFRLVGSLRRQGQVIGLVEADKIVHQVRLGSYIGTDMGKVIAIGDSAIEIEEMVQDAANSWIKRRSRLVLQEGR